jgi:hypothetical protein
MTWQRIDDDTYIDDSLVTCAEFQLFIDELREQGKYYQLDHWTTYQFPKGQARNPILGMRFSDAQTFCEWLTLREDSEWCYRIPKKEEIFTYSSITLSKSPLGHWVAGVRGNHQEFAWLGEKPIDVRSINKPPAFEVAFPFNLNNTLAQSRVRFLDVEFSTAELESSLHVVRKLSKEIEFLRIIDLARSRAQDIRRYIFRTLYIKMDIPKALRRTFEIARILNNILTSNNHQNRTIEFTDRLGQAIDNICKVTIDLFTLQERIAGRSPAFEGIRLVKERIK